MSNSQLLGQILAEAEEEAYWIFLLCPIGGVRDITKYR